MSNMEAAPPAVNDQPLADGAWMDRLDADFLRHAYHEWAGAIESFGDAVQAFRRHGFAAGAQLAAELVFDADYYAEAHPEIAYLPPPERYRYWLTEGLARGHAGCAAEHLARLGLGLTDYPAAFPWQFYTRLRPEAAAQRWAALEDFLETGFGQLGSRIYFGPAAIGFLSTLGIYYSNRNDWLAVRAYERARLCGALDAHELQHLADAYLRLELWSPALAIYRDMIENAASTAWTFRNAVHCLRQLRLDQMPFDALSAAQPRLGGDPLWRQTVGDALAGYFECHECIARGQLAAGMADAADLQIATAVEVMAAQIETLMPPPHQAEVHPKNRYILILANLDDWQRAKRRVAAKQTMLERLGYEARVVSFNEMDHFMEQLPQARAVIAFQIPALPAVVEGLVQARRLGRPIYYDTDRDLSVLPEASPIALYYGFMTSDDYEELCWGQSLYRAAARLCDYGLGPSLRIAQIAGGLCRAGRGFVIGETIDELTTPPARTAGGALWLQSEAFVYLDDSPGSAGQALLEALQCRPGLNLHISGVVKLAPAFTTFSRRITRHDDGALPDACSIAIAAHAPTPDGEYQAMTAWEKAAAAALPCVVYLEGESFPALLHGENVMRAADPAAWLAALLQLVDDPAGAARIGSAAYAALSAQIIPCREGAAVQRALLAGETA